MKYLWNVLKYHIHVFFSFMFYTALSVGLAIKEKSDSKPVSVPQKTCSVIEVTSQTKSCLANYSPFQHLIVCAYGFDAMNTEILSRSWSHFYGHLCWLPLLTNLQSLHGLDSKYFGIIGDELIYFVGFPWQNIQLRGDRMK